MKQMDAAIRKQEMDWKGDGENGSKEKTTKAKVTLCWEWYFN